MPIRTAVLLLLLASVAWAAPPEVPKDLTALPGQLIRITVKSDVELGNTRNFSDSEAFWGELVAPKGQRQFVFQAPLSGYKYQYVVAFWNKGEIDGATTTITIGTPPVPPDPKPPDPKPPDPKPKPPTPIGPLKVLMLYESGVALKPGQHSVLYGKSVRDYLKAKCATDKQAGDGKAYRIWDKDVDVGAADPFWQAAVSRFRSSKAPFVPWWSIYREGLEPVEEGLLPATPADAIATLSKYGG